MAVLVTFTVGLMLWIIMWALGFQAFSTFLLVIFFVLVAIAGRTITPFVKQQLGR
jgi:hypothetical protein